MIAGDRPEKLQNNTKNPHLLLTFLSAINDDILIYKKKKLYLKAFSGEKDVLALIMLILP